jgi:putative membrane protein
MKQDNIDWSVPQRQPRVALVIMIFKTFTEILRNLFPVVIIYFFSKNNNDGNSNRTEIIVSALLLLTLVGGLMKYLYFRFFIENNELIVRSGWIRKKKQVIPLNKINSVHLEQPLIHQLLNVVKLKLETPGSAQTEVTIDCLRRGMANALHDALLQKREEEDRVDEPLAVPIVKLSESDLAKLSLTSNHLETFFIILAFVIGVVDNVSGLGDSFLRSLTNKLPAGSFTFFIFVAVLCLVVTLLISTLRVILKFYRLTVFSHEKGFRIRAGLTTVKERVVSVKKLQFVSWRASWLRKLFGISIFKFHLAGIETGKDSLSAEVPVIRNEILEILSAQYHSMPLLHNSRFIKIDKAFIIRRFLLAGLIPSMAIILISWQWLDLKALWFLVFPLLVLLTSWLHQRKFKAYAMEEVFVLRKGFFGDHSLLLKWEKIQSAGISQTIFQRRKTLANLTLYTATGSIKMKYIPLEAARQVMNYALFRIETAKEPWT